MANMKAAAIRITKTVPEDWLDDEVGFLEKLAANLQFEGTVMNGEYITIDGEYVRHMWIEGVFGDIYDFTLWLKDEDEQSAPVIVTNTEKYYPIWQLIKRLDVRE